MIWNRASCCKGVFDIEAAGGAVIRQPDRIACGCTRRVTVTGPGFDPTLLEAAGSMRPGAQHGRNLGYAPGGRPGGTAERRWTTDPGT